MSCQITNHNTQPQLWGQTPIEIETLWRDISTHLDIFKTASLEIHVKALDSYVRI